MPSDVETRNAEIERLMAETDKVLWSFAHKYASWFNPAEDLYQEGLATAVAHWGRLPERASESWEFKRGCFRQYAKWGMQNLATYRFSQLSGIGKHRDRTPDVSDIQDILELAAAGFHVDSGLEDGLDIKDAMKRLSEDEQQIIKWVYFDCLTLAEVGQRLDMTKQSAWERLHKALNALREYWSGNVEVSNAP